MIFKAKPWRSEKQRRLVASLACIDCEAEGMTQAAHRNEGKGMGIKACDSQLMALCHRCHSFIDQGGKLDKETRRYVELAYVKATRQKLISLNLWSEEAEAAYKKINPPVVADGSINALY